MTPAEARALIEQTQSVVVKSNQPATRYPDDRDQTTNTVDRPAEPRKESNHG